MDRCDHCGSYREVAYTLTAHPESDAEERIDRYFCSSDCLRVWTGSPGVLAASPRRTEDPVVVQSWKDERSAETR